MIHFVRMPRHWSVRVLRAFVALWFVLSVGEPSVVHFCPMHGGMLAELAGASPMAGMAMPGPHHGNGSSHHHCTCIDSCDAAGAAAVLPSLHVSLTPATWTLAATPVATTAESLPRPAPPNAQPPGTGPPRA